MDSVAIDDDVLTEILVGTEASLVRWGWLVDRPVVEWWVDNWVAGLSKLDLLGILLLNMNLIRSNSHVHTEIGISHGVGHEGWVHTNWNSSFIFLSKNLLGSSLGSLLLWKSNLIWTNKDLHVKVGITHSILGNNWVDIDWNTLSKSLLVCDQILHFVILLNLSELHSNWSWLVGNEILQMSS